MRLHHVQVACPRGGEDGARRFYAEGLGLTEVAKPAAPAGRGGAWFRAYAASGDVAAELHVGVEDRRDAAGNRVELLSPRRPAPAGSAGRPGRSTRG